MTRRAKATADMSDEELPKRVMNPRVVEGSGNVFTDLNLPAWHALEADATMALLLLARKHGFSHEDTAKAFAGAAVRAVRDFPAFMRRTGGEG